MPDYVTFRVYNNKSYSKHAKDTNNRRKENTALRHLNWLDMIGLFNFPSSCRFSHFCICKPAFFSLRTNKIVFMDQIVSGPCAVRKMIYSYNDVWGAQEDRQRSAP